MKKWKKSYALILFEKKSILNKYRPITNALPRDVNISALINEVCT